MLAHADKFSQAFSKDGGTVKTKYGDKKKVSFADFEAGNYPADDAWMYSSFWYKDFDGMAYKTMLRQLISKWGIMSIDMASAMDSDMAVINADGTRTYVETEEVETESVQQPVIDAEVTEMDNTPSATVEPASQSSEPDNASQDIAAALFGQGNY